MDRRQARYVFVLAFFVVVFVAIWRLSMTMGFDTIIGELQS